MSLGVRKKGSRLEGDGVVQLIVGFSAVRARQAPIGNPTCLPR